jgi:hypothetical protein
MDKMNLNGHDERRPAPDILDATPAWLVRVKKYVLFVFAAITIPFVLSGILTIIIGSREAGGAYGFAIPFLIINIIFAFFLIKASAITRLISGVIVTILTIGILFIVFSLLEDLFGMDEIRVGLLTFIIASISFWESAYRIVEKLKKRKIKLVT